MGKRSFLALFLSALIILSMIPLSPLAAFGKTSGSTVNIWDGSVASAFNSGIGTEDDPYIIMTASELAYLAALVNGGDECADLYFELGTNIILNDTSVNNWYYSEGVNFWTPIGTVDTNTQYVEYAFGGNFNGKGYSVSGMYVYNEDNSGNCYGFGLFGITNGAVIQNITVKNSLVEAYYSVGGIVGHSYETVISSCVNNSVIADTLAYDAGGIVGHSENSEITGCANKGAIYGQENVGGIVGNAYLSEITRCYNNATINGSSYAGGIVGYVVCSDSNGEYTVISECYNKGNVYGTYNLGGISGGLWGVNISNTHNLGNISGEYNIGGFASDVGANSIVTNCFSTGTVTASSATSCGFTRYLDSTATVTGVYWLMNTARMGVEKIASGASISGIRVIAPEELVDPAVFTSYDFENVWKMGTNGPELIALSATYRETYVEETVPEVTEVNIYLGGVKLQNGKYLANGAAKVSVEKPSEGGYAYYADGVLTLNNYVYEGEGYRYSDYSSLLYVGEDLKIIITGENSLISTGQNDDGITMCASLDISGTGSLDISSDYTVYAENSEAVLNINSGNISFRSEYGIEAPQAVYVNYFNISYGNVSVSSASVGIQSSELNINGGQLEITSDTHCIDSLVTNINDGSVILSSDDGYAFADSKGVYINESMRVSVPEDGSIVDQPEVTIISNVVAPELVVLGGVVLEDGDYLASGAHFVSDAVPAKGGYAFYKNGVLTLNNYAYEGDGFAWNSNDYSAVLYIGKATELVLVGENSLTNTNESSMPIGIGMLAKLTVSGSGSIDLKAAYGIVDTNGSSFTLTSGTINADSANYTYNGSSSGIVIKDIVINGGVLNATGINEGINTYSMVVNAGSVNALAEDAAIFGNILVANGGRTVAEATGDDGVALTAPMVILSASSSATVNGLKLTIGEGMAVSLPENGIVTADTKKVIIEEGEEYVGVVLGGVLLKDGDYLASGADETTKIAPASGGYAYYADGVLTLNDFECIDRYYTYSDHGGSSMAILYTKNALDIVLVGENTLKGGQYVIGIFPGGTVTVSGEGSLTIDTFASIHTISSGTVNIEGGNITLGDTQGFNYLAITIETLNISGGKVTASGIDGVNLNLSDGELIVSKTNNYAINVDNISITGGKLTAESTSHAAFSSESVITRGENIFVTLPESGIIANDTAKAVIEYVSPAEDYVYDLYVGGVGLKNGEYLVNGTVQAEAPEEGGYAYYTDGVLTLNNYTYSGTGFKYELSPNYYTYALIYCEQDLSILLVGENILTSMYVTGDGIVVKNGSLNVTGDGSIELTADYGITANTLYAGADITVIAEDYAIDAAVMLGEDHMIVTPEDGVIEGAATVVIKHYVKTEYMLGDVDGSGEIDQFDYLYVKRAYFNTYTLSEDEALRADVDVSGEIDQVDYLIIKRAYFGTYTIEHK